MYVSRLNLSSLVTRLKIDLTLTIALLNVLPTASFGMCSRCLRDAFETMKRALLYFYGEKEER